MATLLGLKSKITVYLVVWSWERNLTLSCPLVSDFKKIRGAYFIEM